MRPIKLLRLQSSIRQFRMLPPKYVVKLVMNAFVWFIVATEVNREQGEKLVNLPYVKKQVA